MAFSPEDLTRAIYDGQARFIAKNRHGYSYYRHAPTGLVFGYPFPSVEQLTSYYDGFAFQKPDPASFASVKARVDDATAKISRSLIERYGAGSGSLLDFGGGVGFYALGFSQQFDRVALFDIDAQACDYARQMSGDKFETFCGLPDQLLRGDACYDVVFSTHVIEHFLDLNLFFEILMRRTKPGGLLVVATPNRATWEYLARPNLFRYYVQQVVGRNVLRLPRALFRLATDPWLCCDPPRHLYAFDRHSLTHVAQSAGLVVEDVFSEYSFRALYARVSDELGANMGSVAKRVAWSVLNAYARPALRCLELADGARRRGGNLVLIARKPAASPDAAVAHS